MTTRALARAPARTSRRLVETVELEVGAPMVSVDGGVSSSTEPPGVVSSADVVVVGRDATDAADGVVLAGRERGGPIAVDHDVAGGDQHVVDQGGREVGHRERA